MIQSVRLEMSSLCQLHCPVCIHSKRYFPRTLGLGYLKYIDFVKFLKLNPRIKKIELSHCGEVFLNPELEKIFKLAAEKNIMLTINNGTNFNDIKPSTLEALVKYNIVSICISIDGATNDVYKLYRKSGNLHKVLHNIKLLNSYKRSYHSIFPILSWQFIIFGHNQHQIQPARKMAKKLGMTFKLRINGDSYFSPVEKSSIKDKQILNSIDIFSAKHFKIYKSHICNQLWDSPQINWDGTLLGCCINSWQCFDGNAFNTALKILLNKGKIIAAKKMLLKGSAPQKYIPCFYCDIYQQRKNTSSWVKRNSVIRYKFMVMRWLKYMCFIFLKKLIVIF